MKVVDLWGGFRNIQTKEPWMEDTLIVVFSATKGFAALALAVAHSRGYIDYDEKVAAYWPEFAQEGKEDITVRQLLAHQAGLCSLDRLHINQIEDLDTASLAKNIAGAKPEWEPGSRHGYHAWTVGGLIGELVRRVDPAHRTLRQFFEEEIANPLHAQFYIGLPESIPSTRLAIVKGVDHPIQLFLNLHKFPKKLLLGFLNPKSLTSRSLVDPKKFVANKNFNTRSLLSIEFASGNGVGQVRDMAKIYSAFALRDSQLNIKTDTFKELMKPAFPPACGFYDYVNRIELAYSLGFWKPFYGYQFGSSDHAFGHPGAGGSFCFADPDAKIGFAYAMNKFGFGMADDPREVALRNAVYRSLDR
ncbi:EstA family serine hydrolase [Paenibacillus elgii]|uniref:EstA family serine hydrolase n=1 Tax=Paenibacillus elgii TaxID=189691 RepID=A0A2T6G524_9BACL|nr:EstA family serine hydrolase [Paenibacillus elgii]